MITLTINNKQQQLDVTPEMPLLWALRDVLNMTGTKYGCGVGTCGSCTVLIDGVAIRSCQMPVGGLEGAKITTIEGLSTDNSHPLQKAWIDLDVAQCGYCQAGQIMEATALLSTIPKPTDSDIDGAMSAHICRCGTYQRIRAAIHQAAI